MKKAELLRRIVELDERVAKLTDSMKFLVEENAKITHQTREYIERVHAMERRIVAQERFAYRQTNLEAFERLEKLKLAQLAPNKHFAAIAGQPSVTVTATEALTTAEHDMAGKLRELLGPMAPDYMRQIDVPVPPKPAYEQDVNAASVEAAADVAGVHKAMAPDDAFDKALAAANQKLKKELSSEKIFYTSGSPPPSPLLAKVKECFPGISWFHDKNEVFTVADDGRMGIETDYNGKFKAFLNNDRSNAEPLDTALTLLGEHMNPPRRPRKVVAVEQRVVTSGEG